MVEIVGIQKGTFPFLSKILENCFSRVIEDFEMEYPHYFTYYPLGGKHTRHTDSSLGFNRDWIITLYLNDDFEGGELVINNQVSPKKKVINVSPKKKVNKVPSSSSASRASTK